MCIKIFYILISVLYAASAQDFEPGYLNENVPFVVSIQKFVNGTYENICVGTLISPNTVLTSNICVANNNKSQLSIVGNFKFMTTLETLLRSNVTDIIYKRILVLPDYTVLLKIDPPIGNGVITFPKLNCDHGKQNWTEGYLLGWGSLNKQELKLLELLPFHKISSWICFKSFWKVKKYSEFCAIAGGRRGACTSDTGAPLFSKDLKFICGILNKGDPKCSTNVPYIFQDTKSLSSWIEKTTLK